MKILFWNVDTQKDFVEKDGALYVEGAEEIKPVLQRLTKFAEEYGIQVVTTADFHTDKSEEISDKPDFKTTFPPHCIEGTLGASSIEETAPENPYVISYLTEEIDKEKIKATRNIALLKDAFDVFEGNQYTEPVLSAIEPDFIVVYGVATNVCVDKAVQGLVYRGYDVVVVEDAIKGIPNIPVEPVLMDWLKKDVTILTADTLELYLKGVLEKEKMNVAVKKVDETREAWICPYCDKEIGEKEIYNDGKYNYHRPCQDKGAIILPGEENNG